MAFKFEKLNQLSETSYQAIPGGALFDLGNVKDADFRLRIAVSIEWLFKQADLLGGAPSLVVRGIQSRAKRNIRFFDNQAGAVEGTGAEAVTYIEPAGTAAWKWSQGSGRRCRYMDPTIPVAERDDEGIYLANKNATTNVGNYLPTVWHELSHIFTVYQHGKWKVGGGSKFPDLPENVAWHAFMQELKAGAPRSLVDPASGEWSWVSDPATPALEWSCTCESNHIG